MARNTRAQEVADAQFAGFDRGFIYGATLTIITSGGTFTDARQRVHLGSRQITEQERDDTLDLITDFLKRSPDNLDRIPDEWITE